jgi:hypothetical protein
MTIGGIIVAAGSSTRMGGSDKLLLQVGDRPLIAYSLACFDAHPRIDNIVIVASEANEGCIYCKRMHAEVLSRKYINDYVRENFRVLQLNLWGAREVTDFDGKRMTEKALAERWGVIFTPTVVFFKDDLTGLDGKWGRPLEATERLPLGFGADTFYDLFVWVRHKINEQDPNFQRFHIARYAEREALKAAKGN